MTSPASTVTPATPDSPALGYRYQLRFSKTMDLVWIGHQDLMKVLERLIRRASIPMAQSQGFNPRPRMNFVQALGLGIEAHQEVLEMELSENLPPDELLFRLNATSPPGLRFLSVSQPPSRKPAQARTLIYSFAVELQQERREATALAMEEFLNATQFIVERRRDDKVVSLDLRHLVNHLDWTEDGFVRVSLKVTPTATARPEEVLAAIGLKDLYATGTLIRHDLILEDSLKPAAPAPTPAPKD